MEPKTYIVTVDEKSSFTGVMPMLAYGSSRYDKVTITRPVSVAALDGNPKLYTSEVLEKERQAGEQAGQNEAWELARKIAGTVENGSYDWPTLRRIFGKDWSMMKIFDDSYETVKKKISDYQSRPKVGDIVCVHSGNNHYDGRSALVVVIRESKHEGKLCPLLKVVFDDGDVSLYTRDAVDYIKTVGFDKFFSEEEEEE